VLGGESDGELIFSDEDKDEDEKEEEEEGEKDDYCCLKS